MWIHRKFILINPLGVPDKDTQQILRHANVRMTQESYIKTLRTDALISIKMLEAGVSLVDLYELGFANIWTPLDTP